MADQISYFHLGYHDGRLKFLKWLHSQLRITNYYQSKDFSVLPTDVIQKEFSEYERFIRLLLKESSHFTHPKNELLFGIFHTTPTIDIHMILFGLDKSTLKVNEKTNFIHFTSFLYKKSQHRLSFF